MEESSLVSRKSMEEPLFEYSEQLGKNKRGLLCCKCHIRVSLDVTYSSLLPVVLSLVHVSGSWQNGARVPSRPLNRTVRGGTHFLLSSLSMAHILMWVAPICWAAAVPATRCKVYVSAYSSVTHAINSLKPSRTWVTDACGAPPSHDSSSRAC